MRRNSNSSKPQSSRQPPDAAVPDVAGLALQARDGSREAFAELVRLHAGRLCAYLNSMVSNRADAEDLTQETFLRTYGKIASYNPRFAFSTWLYAIGRNLAFSHLRRTPPAATPQIDYGTEERSPELVMSEKDSRNLVWSLARTLPESQREILWLRYAEDCSVEEIASITRRTGIHVKVLLHRARSSLGKQIRNRHSTVAEELYSIAESCGWMRETGGAS